MNMRFFSSFILSTVLFANLVFCSVHVAVKDESGYCVVLNASQITGSIQYYSLQDNKPATYNFDVNETTVKSSGKCHALPNPNYDELTLQFLPNGVLDFQLLWSLHIVFSKNPTSSNHETFASVKYYLEVTLSPSLNSSIASQTYSNEVMPFEMQTTVPGVSYSCSSTKLKLGQDSWLKFSDLRVIANTKMLNETMEDLSVEKCSADNVPLSAGSSVLLIIGILFAVLIVLGVLAGLAIYIKRTRMSH